MSREQSVGRALLFDRLVEGTADGGFTGDSGRRALTRDQLLASIQQELTRLFNTRLPLSPDALLQQERTVLTYGIPDLGAFIPRDKDSEALLMAVLADTVRAFEPRLAEVQVQVAFHQEMRRRMGLVVHAVLETGALRTPVSFPIAVDGGDAPATGEAKTAPI